MEDDQDGAELAAYRRIETCSVEEAEENAKIAIKEAEDYAKGNQDSLSWQFHKDFLIFLEMAKDSLADKRLPADDWKDVATGMDQLLSTYNRLKKLDPETLHDITNYSLAIHYTAWWYWEKRHCRRAQGFAVKSRTKWREHVRKRATELYSSNPKLSGMAATKIIIATKPEGLKFPKDPNVCEFVRFVFKGLKKGK